MLQRGRRLQRAAQGKAANGLGPRYCFILLIVFFLRSHTRDPPLPPPADPPPSTTCGQRHTAPPRRPTLPELPPLPVRRFLADHPSNLPSPSPVRTHHTLTLSLSSVTP
jgi:hypothetical protein